jgi:hypothetical protein
MFMRVLRFREGATIALYDNQMIQDLESLRDVEDKMAEGICCVIRKESGAYPGHAVSLPAEQHLKMLAFWGRHMWRTFRDPEDWQGKLSWDNVKELAQQKSVEDKYAESTDPPTLESTLDMTSAVASFVHMRHYLRKRHSRTMGIPREYITRVKIRGPWDVPDAEEEDTPPYGDPESIYASIDNELIACMPILKIDLSREVLAQDNDTLEANGPFERTFVADSAEVYDILHTVWGKSNWWSH